MSDLKVLAWERRTLHIADKQTAQLLFSIKCSFIVITKLQASLLKYKKVLLQTFSF
jgi:hypothetical protein